MRLFFFSLVCTFIAMGTFIQSAYAQYSPAVNDRINRLERDLNFLQQQVYRGETTAKQATAAAANSTQTLAEISRMQEEIREIRGAVERATYQARRAQDELQRVSDDFEYRLQALELAEQKRKNPETGETSFSIDEGKIPTAANAATATAPQAQASTPAAASSVAAAAPAASAATATATAPQATINTVESAISSADAHYNNAFAMLNRKQYAEAAESFSAFIRQYPSDPLIANAYYWLGESHYARGDYVRAAEQFRKGYESGTSAQKAPDNLLKLGLSLAQVKRKEEACIILQQVVTKFKTASTAATVARAEEARATLQCK